MNDANNNTQLYTSIDMPLWDTVFFAFKGTEDIEDLMTGLNIQSHFKFGGQLHSGFWNCAAGVNIAEIMETLCRGRHVVLTGHSLGGAVAQFAYASGVGRAGSV